MEAEGPIILSTKKKTKDATKKKTKRVTSSNKNTKRSKRARD